MKIFRKHQRKFGITMLLAFAMEIFYPSVSFAITGNNTMPEYRSFEPVATTNMVNLFDGSFTYNIPLLDIPNGYPVNLSYHSSDVNNEAQASWVGLGWTLNPGSINRMKRGMPDDFYNEHVHYHHRMPKNWTVSAAAEIGFELLGKEANQAGLLSGGLEASIRFNNYNGIGYSVRAPFTLAGGVNLDFSYSQGKFGFNPDINPSGFLDSYKKQKNFVKEAATTDEEVAKIMDQAKSDPVSKKKALKSLQEYYSKKAEKSAKKSFSNQVSFSGSAAGFGISSNGSFFGNLAVPPTSFPTGNSPYTGLNVHLKFGVGVNYIPFPMKVEGDLKAGVNINTYAPGSEPATYGYMHSEAAENEDAMMDFYTENDSPYEKRDNILGIPLPNNDVYSLSGEALGGTFRPYRAEYGHYRPNHSKSEIYSVNISGDVGLPSITSVPPIAVNGEATAGVELGGSYAYTSVGDWDANKIDNVSENYKFNGGDENWFFRFSNDMSGSFDLSGNDAPYSPVLKKELTLHAETDFGNFPNQASTRVNTTRARSSYVRSVTEEESKKVSNDVPYKLCEKNLCILDADEQALKYDYDNGNTVPGKTIVELSTHNADGVRYVYGLPVYTRNEKQLSYSLKSGQYNWNDPYTTDEELREKRQGTIAYITSDIDDDAKRKNGYECNTPYTTTHLLTQINNPDYIDRHMDGPTPDDFGSYTKFNYIRYAGGDDNWYPYRSPYVGTDFSYGSLSDNRDDMGSFSYGEKELYYMQSIASKTHVAVFTLSDREDGAGAKLNASSANPTDRDIEAIIKGEATGITAQKLKKLDKIDLYAISDMQEWRKTVDGSTTTFDLKDIDAALSEDEQLTGIYVPKANAVPIKTVRLEYDYTLCENLPNNINGNGKLTLKSVWFEYEGKLTSKISPYVFDYKYPASTEVNYPAPYTDFYSSLASSEEAQNPVYSPLNTDRWGNYRDYDAMATKLTDLARFYPFVDQHPNLTTFDPAAWCLKRITLPSGGEIHVQYEQNDYQFVQDQVATVMVPLLGGEDGTSPDEGATDDTDKKYYLDLSKIGINFSDLGEKKQETVEQLFAPMREKKDRIFFNFLYRLIDDEDPDITNTSSDFIEGYARIDGYGYDSNGPFFTFKRRGAISATYYQDIEYDAKVSKREIPRKVCRDFYNTQRRGLLAGKANALSDAVDGEKKGKEIADAFITLLKSATTANVCMKMDPLKSYVKVQMPYSKPKLGGGVRVKRLLMYEAGAFNNGGMPNSDPSLYGNEYSYKTTDKDGRTISSGVASNEPSTGRRENPLVKPIDKDRQSWYEAILFGRDMYAQEGPLGEGLMPGASVGYSKVTIKNIHQGKTSTGSEEHEFYTFKEFPFLAQRNTIDQAFKTKLGAGLSIPAGNVGVNISYTRQNPYLVQGYSFINHGMNGQKKRSAKYPMGSSKALAEEVYEYYKPGDAVGMMDETMNVVNKHIYDFGKESEILSERRQVGDVSFGGNVGVDATIGPIVLGPPSPLPLAFTLPYKTKIKVGVSVDEKILHTHVTSKIITYPAIVKRVTNRSDGVRNISENLVLDKYTGNPVVVRTHDDFTGTYLNHDYMASYSHPNMRSKAINEKVKISATAFHPGSGQSRPYLSYYASSEPCTELAKFIKGDLLELNEITAEPVTPLPFGLYHVDEVDVNHSVVYLQRSGLDKGDLTESCSVNVYIESSGYTNQLNAKQGNIMTHGEDIESVSIGAGTAGPSNDPADDADVAEFLALLNECLSPGHGGINIVNYPNSSGPFVSISSSACERIPGFKITLLVPLAGIHGDTPFSCEYNSSCENLEIVIPTFFGQTIPPLGTFSIDDQGNLVYNGERPPGILYTISTCLQFCKTCIPASQPTPLIQNVVSASAVQYKDGWDYNAAVYPFSETYNTFSEEGHGPDKFENGTLGKWRPWKQYVYRENINQAAAPNPQSLPYKNFNEGKFGLTFFNWQDAAENNEDKWVLTSKTNKYTPNGEAEEDENILGIKSTAKFGYNHTLPVCVAQNAAANTVIYESFENLYTNEDNENKVFEENVVYNTDNGTLNSTVSHTGKRSVLLKSGQDFEVGTINVTSGSSAAKGLIARVWLYSGKNYSLQNGDVSIVVNSGTPIPLTLVSTAGKWSLFEAPVAGTTGSKNMEVHASVAGIYMDDVRVQPVESEMVCYVYDKAQRLHAVLDDQHYAMLYEYNSEGVLVRKLKETIQGIKTVSETQYNSKGKLRYP